MTSRVSFVKKYHLTSMLVLCLAFTIHFIAMFMGVENILDRASYPFEEYTIRQLVGIYSPQITNGLFALIAGAYMAFDYFKYLHSRKETDFYDSLPVTRTKRFFSNFICGFSTYVVLLFVTLGAELIVGKVLGIESHLILTNSVWNFICMVGIYLISWVTAALAMIMTGHPLIAILGYGAFSVYVPVLLYNLIPTFSSIYFETYTNLPVYSKFNYLNIFNYLSPASLMYKVTHYYSNFWTFSDHRIPILGMIIYIVAVGYLAYRLFKKRAAESAGRAMAFEKFNSIIRILIVVPVALYLGVFLKSMSSNESDMWLLFGIIFSAAICHGIIQGIFESDIKAAFTKKKQFILTILICFVFISIFKFDLFKFDEYIPEVDKVVRINIETNIFSNNLNYEYSDGITGEDLELALLAADEIIHSEQGVENISLQFEYQLKNGIIISRNYLVPLDNVPKSLDALVTKEDFKDDYCMFYKKDLEDFSSFSYTMDHENYIPITGNDLRELAHVYVEEFTEMTFTDLYKEPVVYRFFAYYDNEIDTEIAVTSSSPAYYYHVEEYQEVFNFDVYASFDKTIEVLNRLGYKSFADNDELELLSLEVYSNTENFDGKIITDINLLSKLKQHAFMSEYNRFYNDSELVYGWANVKTDTHEFYCDLYFDKEVFEQIVK